MDKLIRFSEIFFSPQGEGEFTGHPTVWLRFFNCNLQCNGFGQSDPTDESTYILPYQTYELIDVKRLEDLPVFEYGCDSSYSWSKRYRHLSKTGTVDEVCDAIIDAIRSPSNPDGLFVHPVTKRSIHLAFTGGEPMLEQEAIVSIISTLMRRNNVPRDVTIETNGTQPLTDVFRIFADGWFPSIFFSISPKLFNVSGEKNNRAIKPEVVQSYYDLGYGFGQLKFVMSDKEEAWQEMYRVIDELNVEFPVWIMPVGATDEGQSRVAASVAKRAIEEGYLVSARAHIALFGNCIGT